ncbi:phosphonate metabolism transcriptional regulator PhnF [Bradyrhizobium iriomotense]|uniref:phosphonate metabolism transcriptional regulator PhnF n=1 Tax=Bradyrhizobium iriomotense TaxID=441950 RepID=UPI003D67819A
MKDKKTRASGPHFPSCPGRASWKPGIAVWRQLEELLVAELSSGKYPVGLRLPTEQELMSRTGVGRHTLRQAMATLEAKGLVRIEQGRGTFVHEQVLHYQSCRRSRFRENLQQQGREPHYHVVSAEVVGASSKLQNALDLQPGSTIVHLIVDALSGPALLANTDLFFDRTRFPEAAHIVGQERSIRAVYSHYGIKQYTCAGTIIRSRLPTAAEARRLHQPKLTPIFLTKTLDVTIDNRPIGYSESRWCSDRVEFIVGTSEKLYRPARRK